MSSPGSRGPPMSRYKSDYDYNKPKRRPYHGSQPQRPPSGTSLAGSSLPGSSSLTHSTGFDNSNPPLNNSRSRYASSSMNNGSAPPSRDRSTYGSYSSSSKNSYGSYYSSYGSYNSFKRDSNDTWRSDRYNKFNGLSSTSADHRLAGGRNPSLSGTGPASSSVSSTASYSSRPISERYDSYSGDSARKSSYPRAANRNSLSNSVGSRSAKERRGSLVSTGHRADTYYPNKASNLIYNKAQVDNYPRGRPGIDKDKSQSSEKEDNEENTSDNDTRDENMTNKYNYEEDDEDDESESERNEDSGDDSESDYNPLSLGLPIDGIDNKDEATKDDESIVNETRVFEDSSKTDPRYADTSTEEPQPTGIFPPNRLEGMYLALMEEYETKQVTPKYSTSNVVTNFHDYAFFNRNLKLHSIRKHTLLYFLSSQAAAVEKKRLQLWKIYKQGLANWEKSRKCMDQQLQLLHPPNDEMKKELEQIDVRLKKESVSESSPSTPAGISRRSRRHGDSVTTEAEFEEILKSLTKQDNEDPHVKAQRLSAPIPDLILDPTERENLKFMDSNNFVTDKAEWASRVRTEFFDNFSVEEHALFCEGFVKHPKKFGFIARHLGGLRTIRECVIHYYLTKKGVNYKNLVLQHKRKNRKAANARGRGKPKSRNVSQTNTPVETAAEELEDPEVAPVAKEVTPVAKELTPVAIPIPPAYNANDSLGEELFTETGRRKRAAAPKFEGADKKPVENINAPPKKRAKKKKEDTKKMDDRQDNEGAEGTDILNGIEIESKEQHQVEPDNGPPENNTSVETGSQASDEGRDKRTITSYWSISESTLFPELLKAYGTKWTTIADKLNTKTATMVRNYFQRNASKFEWLNIAEEADKRLEEKFASVFSKPEDGDDDASDGEVKLNGTDKHLEHAAPLNSILTETTSAPTRSSSPVTNGHVNKIGPETTVKTEPHSTKPSIMSLLNSEPSPVKLAPSQSTIDPELEGLSTPSAAKPVLPNNSDGILYGPAANPIPPVSAKQQFPNTRVMPRLSTILSGDSPNDDDK